jgi:hypothetical protein
MVDSSSDTASTDGADDWDDLEVQLTTGKVLSGEGIVRINFITRVASTRLTSDLFLPQANCLLDQSVTEIAQEKVWRGCEH